MPALLILIPVALGLFFISAWIYRGLRGNKIRGQLNSGFVLMALFPSVAISLGTMAIGYVGWRNQAITRLESVAALKETRLTAWLQDLQGNLLVTLNEEYAVERATVVLSLANANKYSGIYQKAMRSRFQRFVEQSQLFTEIFLLDVAGRVIVSTDLTKEGSEYRDQPFFIRGQEMPYLQLPFTATNGRMDGVIMAVPVTNNQGTLLGVLVGRSTIGPLTTLLDERTGLGISGKAYLVNPDFNLLTSAGQIPPTSVATEGVVAVTQKKSNGVARYTDADGQPVIGVYRWLSNVEAGLLVEQDESEALQSITATLGVNFGVIILSVLLAVGASWMITRTIASPLDNLVNTARQIAAGDLNRAARADRPDEINALAEAFNSMTTQLRDSINSLEQRVRDRTETLRQRAVQLETSAKVSREITSILEIDDLLARVVELIRDAFGYYHVNVYLLNDDGTQLVLKASSGEAIPQMTSLDMTSPSLNSEAAATQQAILLNDVIRDPRYLADPQLPETRSEVVVPMRMGGRVIGTVDVNSNARGSFTSEDVLVLQSLADQIAVAIENARLYEQSRELAVLEERHRLARELHDAVTQSLFSIDLHAKAIATYALHRPEQTEKHIQHLRQITHATLQEMRALILDLRPVSLEKDGLAQTLRQHINVLQRANNLSIELTVAAERRLPLHLEKQLYRIAQEALSNAIRHAQAHRIEVHLSTGPEQIELSIKDDGCGFEPDAVTNERAFGLSGMRERVAAIHGRLDLLAQPGQGCEVRVRAPA